jgi:hypothetical protein
MIVTVALSKLSIGLLFKNLMNRGIARWANWGLIGAVIAWTVASIVALAARCSSPHPWSFVDGKCDYQVRGLLMAMDVVLFGPQQHL